MKTETKTKISKPPSLMDRVMAPALRLMDRLSGRHVPTPRPKPRRSA